MQGTSDLGFRLPGRVLNRSCTAKRAKSLELACAFFIVLSCPPSQRRFDLPAKRQQLVDKLWDLTAVPKIGQIASIWLDPLISASRMSTRVEQARVKAGKTISSPVSLLARRISRGGNGRSCSAPPLARKCDVDRSRQGVHGADAAECVRRACAMRTSPGHSKKSATR